MKYQDLLFYILYEFTLKISRKDRPLEHHSQLIVHISMKHHFQKIEQKIYSLATLQIAVQDWRAAGQTLVFTNGCFDLLHYGHIYYLAQAADLADHLIIGLNSDVSVSRLKGKHRPIKDQKNRTHILAALAFVDAVILFDTDTPYELIKDLQPDILVKGGDWQPEQIVGSDIVLADGGQVMSLPFIEGYSTTFLENKIKEGIS